MPTDPLRVLMAGHTHPQVGGLVHYTHSLANALQAHPGAAVRLLDLSGLAPRRLYSGRGRQSSQSVPLHSMVPVVRGPGLAGLPGWSRTRDALAQADVIHLQLSDPAFAPVMLRLARQARRRGVAVVATVHDLQPHRSWQRPLNAVLARAARGADRVLVHSQGLVATCSERFRIEAQRIGVVPHAAYDAFGAERWSKREARVRLGLDPAAKILLAFGSVLPYKGTDVAVAALPHLPAEVHLVVAGPDKGPWSAIRAEAVRLGVADRLHDHVRLLPDDEIGLYLRAADVAVLPYRDFFSQSGAAMAAVGAGLPVVVSDLPSLRDLAPARLRARPGDPEALAAAIRSWLADPTAAPVAATWASVAGLTVAEYRTAMAARADA